MSISKEAKDISKEFARLRQFGYLVYNFNTQTGMKSGSQRGLCDHLIISIYGIHFIEVKLKSTKDKIRESQKPLAQILKKLTSKDIYYWIVDSLERAKSLVYTLTPKEIKLP